MTKRVSLLLRYPFSFCEKETATKTKGRLEHTAIYYLEAKTVSRESGHSADDASAYLGCANILDYYGIWYGFTRKEALVWQKFFSVFIQNCFVEEKMRTDDALQ